MPINYRYHPTLGIAVRSDGMLLLPRRKSAVWAYGLPSRSGQFYVSVRGKRLPVSRIVAETFVPNPRKLPRVRHVNGRLHDNSASNLEWCEDKRP